MSVKLFETSVIEDIAEAIRQKSGKSELLNIRQFAPEIRSLDQGNAAVKPLVIESREILTYDATEDDEGYVGFNPITLELPEEEPILKPLVVTSAEPTTYNIEDEEPSEEGPYTGYSPVTVDIQEEEYCWTPPAGCPDISVLDLSDFNSIFMYTYKYTPGSPMNFIKAPTTVQGSGNVTIDMGTVVDGEFVVESVLTTTLGSGKNIRFDIPETQLEYPVVRIYPTNKTQYITAQYFSDPEEKINSTTTAKLGNVLLPIIDVRIKAPKLTTMNTSRKTRFFERVIYEDLTTALNSCASMLNACYSLKEIIFKNCDFSNVTTWSSAFQSCTNLKSIKGLRNAVSSKATTLRSMFTDCRSLEWVDCSGWNTSGCTTIAQMFYGCYSLRKPCIENIDVSNVTDFTSVYRNCYSLKELDLSNWVTSSAQILEYVFNGTNSLEYLDISNFDFSNVTSIAYMFGNSVNLKHIEFPENYSFPLVTNFTTCFTNNYTLDEIDMSKLDCSKAESGKYTHPTNCYGCKRILPAQNLDIDWNIANFYSLDVPQLLEVLEALPVVSTARKLTLGSASIARLTTEQIGSITSKGWTLA